MVGGTSSSLLQLFLYHLSFLTRIRAQVPVAVTIIMLLSHAALASAAPSGSIRKITHTLALDTSEEKMPLSKPTQPLITAVTTRLYRHILLVSGGAVGSTRNVEDQAVRALVGSSPPKCVKKCGACTPCKSVLVPIHTNNLPATPAEYYPEAWRCQCKGKIYNP